MSAVWNVFRKMTDEYGNMVAVCTVCSRSLKVPKSKTTTNLLAHLRNNHCDELGGFTRRRYDAAIPSGSGTGGAVEDHRPPAHRRLARLIIDGTLPLEATSLKSFREFVSALNPSYHTPSTRTLRNILEEECFRNEMMTRTMLADTTSKISLTVDFHPAFRAHTGLLLVSGHLMSQNSVEKRNLILDCVPIGLESFSGYAVSEIVTNSLRRFDVDVDRISTIVANETTPIQEAALYLHAKFVPCVAHSIGLAVSDTVRPEQSFGVLDKVRCLVLEVQRNWNAKMQLKSRLRERKLPELSPVADTPSRWTSTYEMIYEVLLTLPVFNDLVLKLNLPGLDTEETQLLETMRVLLEPFHTLMKQVCARDATCSVYLAVGRILLTTTEKLISQTFGEAQRFGRCLLDNTSKYFTAWLGDEFLQTAAFLDPRFAYLETIQPMKSWTETMERFIANQRGIQAEKESKIPQQRPEEWTQEFQSPSTSVWEVLRENREEPDVRIASAWNLGDGLRAELQHYGGLLLSSRPAFGADPIHWWKAYMNEFPQLAEAAFGYLSTPATSVDCERLFSLHTISPSSKHCTTKNRKLHHMLLTLKANLNKEVARECKGWSAAEVHRYSFEETAVDDLLEYDVDDDALWTTNRSDEEKAVVDNADSSLVSFMEGGNLDATKNKQ